MEVNIEEALKAKADAEKRFADKDFVGAKSSALKAEKLCPDLEGIAQMVLTFGVYSAAEMKINGEVDFYAVLGLDPSADKAKVKKQYKKMAVLLHPDKNKSIGADGAFKLVSEAWTVLSDVAKKSSYDHRRNISSMHTASAASHSRLDTFCGDGGVEMMRKRKLSDEQVKLLEQSFWDEHKLETGRKDRLASELGLDPRQVAVWFQNRRARWKSKRIEEEYSRLKSEHETAVVEKCRLEAEVLKLKEQLSDAEKKIQRMSLELSDGASAASPSSSSFSMVSSPPFLGDQFITGSFDNVFYVPEWDNLYI